MPRDSRRKCHGETRIRSDNNVDETEAEDEEDGRPKNFWDSFIDGDEYDVESESSVDSEEKGLRAVFNENGTVDTPSPILFSDEPWSIPDSRFPVFASFRQQKLFPLFLENPPQEPSTEKASRKLWGPFPARRRRGE